jgi:hypothetical protein
MGSGGIDPPFLISAFDGAEWSVSRPGRFTPIETAPGIHWTGRWVGFNAGLDVVEKRNIFAPAGNLTSAD